MSGHHSRVYDRIPPFHHDRLVAWHAEECVSRLQESHPNPAFTKADVSGPNFIFQENKIFGFRKALEFGGRVSGDFNKRKERK
jgi:hypothetical protein